MITKKEVANLIVFTRVGKNNVVSSFTNKLFSSLEVFSHFHLHLYLVWQKYLVHSRYTFISVSFDSNLCTF